MSVRRNKRSTKLTLDYLTDLLFQGVNKLKALAKQLKMNQPVKEMVTRLDVY